MECYSMEDITAKVGLNREHLVALGLLIGCDYTEGVKGIGKEYAVNFVKMCKDLPVLTR